MAQGSVTTTIAATGTNITGGAAQTYTFATECEDALVFIHPNCGDIIFGKWNDDESTPVVAANVCDFILSADGILWASKKGSRGKGTLIKTVGLYSLTDSVLNTDYFVVGDPYRI